MLILPLHRPLTRATFPFVTVALILINVVVFLLLQGGDYRRLDALGNWYRSSGLVELEWPEYLRHVQEHGDAGVLALEGELDDDTRAWMLLQGRLSDARLDARLKAAPPGDAESDGADPLVHWALLEEEFQARRARITTFRYALRYSEVDPGRMFSHAFLHGGFMHLIGNMFFLAALGLLVEGALGEWRFALLYALSILGSCLFSLAWHWGDGGAGLGASGAIAGLMGAFCVVWGRRPVRFFWWFFVLFGYVRKPAIWLLPAWIGWEVFNLIFNAEAGIGFEAHLGGLLSGALVGWVFVGTAQVRDGFLDDEDSEADLEQDLAEVRGLLGRMQTADAMVRLAPLEEEYPEHLGIAVIQHRTAVLRGMQREAQRHALRALQIDAANTDEVALQLAVLEEAFPSDYPLPVGQWRESLRRRWMALDCHASVQSLLERAPADNDAPRHWFELALRLREQGDEAGFRRVLGVLQQRFPIAPEAEKARFWLEQQAL